MSSSNGSMNGLLHEGDFVARGYQVLGHLSRNRALDVYDAWSLERDCRCIAKVVRPDRHEARVRRRLTREGELLLQLTHPHIVRAYELRRRPRTALILETLGGDTVEHMIEAASRRLAIADVAHLGVQLCSAIGYMHGRGFLHLDLKPSNVIVQNGQATVIDLQPGAQARTRAARDGLCALAAPRAGARRSGRCGERRLGDRGDPVEAATGMRPFPDAKPRIYPQLERRAPDLGETRRAPAAFASVIAACLSPDPSDRPSVGELADELDEVVGD